MLAHGGAEESSEDGGVPFYVLDVVGIFVITQGVNLGQPLANLGDERVGEALPTCWASAWPTATVSAGQLT